MAAKFTRAKSVIRTVFAIRNNGIVSARLRNRRMAKALSSPMTLNNDSNTTIPKLLYGTAWKKERTADLVYQAIKSGFRGIDTAAQPRHYQEHLVGDGIRRAIKDGLVRREELYIQTKFTGLSGQDPKNMPYSASQPLPERIHTSLASSFKNLQTSSNTEDTYLDCLVLHSPLPTLHETHQAWEIFSSYVPHRIRSLGISNTTLSVLTSLHSSFPITPSIVQNRFYPDTDWDVPLRQFCREHGIIFQSFWTFTGNPGLVQSKPVVELASELRKIGVKQGEAEVVALYALVIGLQRLTVLDGTTNLERMRADLTGLDKVGRWAEGSGKNVWQGYLADFKSLLGEEVVV